VTQQIRRTDGDTKILFLSQENSWEYVSAALQAGGNGYITKQASSVELLNAIEAILRGEVYITDKLNGSIPAPTTAKVRQVYDELVKAQSELLAASEVLHDALALSRDTAWNTDGALKLKQARILHEQARTKLSAKLRAYLDAQATKPRI
jgi:DNA-binding response OmpR family regulator